MAFEWADPQEPPEVNTDEIERIARLFQTDDGEKVLKLWIEAFCMGPRTDMDPSGYKQGFLDGQAHIAKMIVQCIRTVNDE